MRRFAAVWAMTVVLGCGDDEGAAGTGGSGGSGDSDAAIGDGGGTASCEPHTPADVVDASSCFIASDDYRPCAEDDWPACISDDGEYHRIEATISTIARVEAFEEIAALLFDPTQDATSDDFLAARLIYQADEGLDSRVVRRYDPHFDAPEGTDCTLRDAPAMEPDYCVGPAILQPLLLEAFNAGIMEDSPRVQAGRIEAALLWFLYVSTAKESLTCTEVAKDCDSAYAYYTGGEEARDGIALARRIREADASAHDRAWDGLLALRCWRDLDDAEVAEDTALRERARTQLDRALISGLASVVREAIYSAADMAGDEQAYHWAFASTLGRALDRAAREASPSDAEVLATEFAHEDPADASAAGIVAALNNAFECP